MIQGMPSGRTTSLECGDPSPLSFRVPANVPLRCDFLLLPVLQGLLTQSKSSLKDLPFSTFLYFSLPYYIFSPLSPKYGMGPWEKRDWLNFV
jgi:hypothetical protein